ncbi:hypothetical protein PG1616B_1034 [Bifidobacterium pseudolongum subsp. globosum]|nr:hypothetical protein PG1616B_1034 [Bifidobacterium pseudolongum subsp. globosum]
MGVLHWLNDTGWGNAVAVVALIVAVWQAVRAEGMLSPRAVHVSVRRLRLLTATVSAGPFAGFSLYDVSLSVIDGCRVVDDDNDEPCADTLQDGEEVRLTVQMIDNSEQRVLLQWVEPTLLRRRPCAHARRITFDLHRHPHPVTAERWRWNMTAPLARLANRSICRRKPLALGKWVPLGTPWWKSSLPENAGSMPGRGTRTGRKSRRSASVSAGGAGHVVRR